MTETDTYLFDIEQPREWVFRGEPVWIGGWLVPKGGSVFSDIRALVDGVPYLGFLGIPHEHVEMRHRGFCGLPHAAFGLLITPPLGTREIVIQLLDGTNRWVDLWRTPVQVLAGPSRHPSLEPELIPPLLRRLLQAQRARPRKGLIKLSCQLLDEAGQVPLDTLPNPPFFGALESPSRVGGTQSGKLRVEGWLIHKEQQITRLIGTTHPLVENTVIHNHRPRPEAGALFPEHPDAAHSQFFGMLDIDEHAPNPVCVKLFAEIEDGSCHLVWTRRVFQRTCRQQELLLPARGGVAFARAVTALAAGCVLKRARLPAWESTRMGIRDARESFNRDAPKSLPRHDPRADARPVRQKVPDDSGRPLHVLLITHNLRLEGAPLFLHEYATFLVRSAGFTITVVSGEEGPLRASYEKLGASIHVVDSGPIHSAPDGDAFGARIAEIQTRLPVAAADVVVCNTLMSFWGVHLARRAGKPSLFYIHESTSIRRFFGRHLAEPIFREVEAAFTGATRALFLCQATRAYYEDHNRHGNFRIIPSWIQIDRIEEFKRSNTRAALRRKYGFADNEIIVANIGTVCERKGQHVFIRAVEHFNRCHAGPGPDPFRFLMVGARPDVYLDIINADIARLGVTNITQIPETREPYDFFMLSDVFVCTSFEESFPRVIMEAMAFQTPIVSTDVHGIKEMVRNGIEARLVAPGDPVELSNMMRTCLVEERAGRTLTPAAQTRVTGSYRSRNILPVHVALLREVFVPQNGPVRGDT